MEEKPVPVNFRDDLRYGEWVLSNVPNSRLAANKGAAQNSYISKQQTRASY